MQVDCIWFIEFQLETNLHQPPKCSHHQSDEARAKHSLWNTDAIQIYAKHAIDTSFYATKNGFFCTRNLNCKPMILYGKYQLIHTYRVVGINIWSSAHQNESITVNFYINLLARVIQGLKWSNAKTQFKMWSTLSMCSAQLTAWHTRTRIHTTIVT